MTVVDLFGWVAGLFTLAPWWLQFGVVVGLHAALWWWVGSLVVGRSDTRAAVWVKITPPAHLPPEASVRFARSLAGVLHRTRRYGWRLRYVACEFVATDTGMGLGVWVPPAISPKAVIAAVTGAWPGARAVVSAVPDVSGGGVVRGREVLPRGGEWSPWWRRRNLRCRCERVRMRSTRWGRCWRCWPGAPRRRSGVCR
ncbi:hypothetical protein [Nocardia brasiliensis]|uniref:hypothetical protein n=1 Tax=Nocardia brasiliensis TaxID=37326 RepID=UPI001895E161|nr:hypothetical protein [Nocardia brasiliensis]MBF6131147.1 hypothetical protein [Nocardia brasiliensis]